MASPESARLLYCQSLKSATLAGDPAPFADSGPQQKHRVDASEALQRAGRGPARAYLKWAS
eukprot:10211155-Alexandrium_andersonii.AAC.2